MKEQNWKERFEIEYRKSKHFCRACFDFYVNFISSELEKAELRGFELSIKILEENGWGALLKKVESLAK